MFSKIHSGILILMRKKERNFKEKIQQINNKVKRTRRIKITRKISGRKFQPKSPYISNNSL